MSYKKRSSIQSSIQSFISFSEKLPSNKTQNLKKVSSVQRNELVCSSSTQQNNEKSINAIVAPPANKKRKITTFPTKEAKSPEHSMYQEGKQIYSNISKFMRTAQTIQSTLPNTNAMKLFKLTPDGASWLIYAPRYKCSSKWISLKTSESTFQEQWDSHPDERKCLGKLYGRICYENRWSQSYGVSYSYSGYNEPKQGQKNRNINTTAHRPIQDDPILFEFINEINNILLVTNSIAQTRERKETDSNDLVANNQRVLSRFFNGCLKNWYLPEHSLAAHSDDEKQMRPNSPIFSLSWGGPRRFLIKPKLKKQCGQTSNYDSPLISGSTGLELLVQDGDLIVMGGSMQSTHKHEVPKWRKTKDPPTDKRINWTVREFITD